MSMKAWFAIAAVFATITSCTAHRETAPPAPPPPPPQARYLQVVAHPDDDLLFMNPDLAEGLRAGRPTTGVYLTAGESDMPDRARYGADRLAGTRASYAQMAGEPNDWSRSTIPVGEGRMAELYRLHGDPDVSLVFLNLPEDANPQNGGHSLSQLRQDPALAVRSTVPAGSTVPHPQLYDRSAVIEALTSLLNDFRPTVVRLQDDQPDQRYQAAWNGTHNHPDHVVGAALAREALKQQHPDGVPPTVLTYRDYNVADTPGGLSEQDKQTTREAFAAYAAHDVLVNGGVYHRWSDRSAYRWPRRDTWAARDSHGQVHAFSVRANGLAHWIRTRQGTWRGPQPQASPEPLRPQLSVVGNGKLVLVAQSADGARILIKRQDGRGNWPARWQTVGAPPAADPTQLGQPAATVDAHGRLVLAIKNAAGGVSLRRESATGWQPWHELGGSDVQDGLSVVEGPGGTHVFAANRDQVLHWNPAGSIEVVPIGAARPAGDPAAEPGRDGRIHLMVRTDHNGELVTRVRTPTGGWEERPTLPSPGGIGDPTLTEPGSGQPLAVARDTAGAVHVSGPHGWADLGGAVTDHPATVTMPNGARTLIALAANGRLVVNRTTPSHPWNGWHPAIPTPNRTAD